MTVFAFKQFSVKQSDAAMKVGTDSVLLGSLLKADEPLQILDIGTGTGLLALMMAQRFGAAQIDAVEIDDGAAEEARYNIAQSEWVHRMTVTNQAFQEFGVVQKQYDLIVSNPPYYEAGNHFSIEKEQRSRARHTGSLSFEDLLTGIRHLLSPAGICWMVLPVEAYERIKPVILGKGLFISEQIAIYPKVGKECNRIVFCLTRENKDLHQRNFWIYRDDGQYTPEYKNCTYPFLLWRE
jgi:tRNA1Val (adenine37-N6)-methyltransferase